VADSELVQAYDTLFSEGKLRDAEGLYRWALARLAPERGALLLDVACGQGLLLAQAVRAGLKTCGVDFSPQALAMARAREPRACVLLANGERLPFADQSLDYVTCLGSLEHFRDPWQGASEIRRVLKPHGRAALILPNAYYLADIVWHVLRRGRGPRHKQCIERFATAQEWADLLEMMGLKVTATQAWNFLWPRTWADWRWYLANPRKILYLLSSLVTPFNLSCQFLYLCTVSDPRPDLNERLPLVLRRTEPCCEER